MRWTAVWIISVLALVVPSIGSAQTSPQPRSAYEVIPGFDVPGTPNDLDRIAFVRHWHGPPTPSRAPLAVLILVPGFFGGAEDFRYAGERLVTRLPWLQVWAVDRRNNLLENRCGMEAAQSVGNPLVAVAYYLGGQDLAGCPPHSDADETVWNGVAAEFSASEAEAEAVGMARWGLETSLQDLKLLVAHARQQYPRAKVYLGGHSLGGMTAQIYAAWRFGSTPATAGWHSIDGLVLVDGGVDGLNWTPGLILQYLFERALVGAGTVFWDDLSRGATPLPGVIGEIAGMAASMFPADESLLWPILPPGLFAWPNAFTCPTNKALLAALSDDNTGTSPDFILHQGILSAPIGTCAPPHEQRVLLHWVDFNQVSPPELASTDVWAETLWKSRVTNVVEWYFSIMLNADIDLASNLDSTVPIPLAGGLTGFQLEGHRIFETSSVAIPVYAFAANECRGRFDWYETVATAITDFTLIDHSNTGCPSPAPVPYAHQDPLFAFDTSGFTNAFVATLADWMRTRVPGRP